MAVREFCSCGKAFAAGPCRSSSLALNSVEMTSTLESTSLAGFDAEQFQSFVAAPQEPYAVVENRRRAFDQFVEKSREPLDPEEFKRVDLRTFRPAKFSIVPPGSMQDVSALASFGTLLEGRAEFAGSVAHVDGRCVRTELSADLLKKGV